MNTLILYYTKTGHTFEAVTPLAEGIKEKGHDADLVDVKDFSPAKLDGYDSFIVASPCWGGSMPLMGTATPLIKAIKQLEDGALEEKLCGAVSVHAASGGKRTINQIKGFLNKNGCNNFIVGPVGKAGSLAGITKGPALSNEDKDLFKKFGHEFTIKL